MEPQRVRHDWATKHTHSTSEWHLDGFTVFLLEILFQWIIKLHLNGGKQKSVQSLSRVQPFVTPWTVAHQASLSITNYWNLPKLISIESVMPSNHLILCYPLLLPPSIFPSIGVFSKESVKQLTDFGHQSIGVSASMSVLPVNTQDWSPWGWTGWISLQSKGLSRVFFNTTVQKHQFFRAQLSEQNKWANNFIK